MLFVINAAVFLPAPGAVPWREAMVGIVLLLCGLGGGIAALIALVRGHEHSALVWLALLPGLFVLFMIGEFLVPLFDQYGASEHGASITAALASENTLTGADPSAALWLAVGGSRHGVSGSNGPCSIPRMPPFAFLIKVDQHNAQCVSWQIVPLVAH